MEATSINPGEALLMASSTFTLQRKLLTQFVFAKLSPISYYNLQFKKDFWLIQASSSTMIQLLQTELDICFVHLWALSPVENNFQVSHLPFRNNGFHLQHSLQRAFHL